MVKFENFSPMDAKWMEEGDLANSSKVLNLYIEAFRLEPLLSWFREAVLEGVLFGALPHATLLVGANRYHMDL